MRPIIGITANFRNDGEMEYSRSLGFADQKWHSLADDYIQTVLRAGGIPVILPVLSGPAVREDGAAQTEWMHMLQGLDGIIFSGGSDVKGSANDLKNAYPQYTWGESRLMNE